LDTGIAAVAMYRIPRNDITEHVSVDVISLAGVVNEWRTSGL